MREREPSSRPTGLGRLAIVVMILLGIFMLCILASIGVAVMRSWF